jgi:hypothetical protein
VTSPCGDGDVRGDENFAKNASTKNYLCTARVRVARVRFSRQRARASKQWRVSSRVFGDAAVGARARWCTGWLRWRAGWRRWCAGPRRRVAAVTRWRCGCEQRASRARRHGADTDGAAAGTGARARQLGKEMTLRMAVDREERGRTRDPNVRLKRVRSAFHAMTGRGGRMTGRGGGSLRSQSSKLLERPDVFDYA